MNPAALQQYATWLPGRAKRPFLFPEHAVIVAVKDPTLPTRAEAWKERKASPYLAAGPIRDAWECVACNERTEERLATCPLCGNQSDDGVLVSAVSLFPTKGVFLMVEQCATNPEVPARVRHAAVEYMFEAVRTYAAITGKMPFMITNKLSLHKLAKKHGWVPHDFASVLECDPLHPVMPLNRREPHATKREALSTSSPERKRGRSSGGVRQRTSG